MGQGKWNRTYLEVFEDYLPGICLCIILFIILLATVLLQLMPSSEEINAAREKFIERETEMRRSLTE